MDPLTIYFIVPRIERTGGYEHQALALAQALLRDPSVQLRIVTDTPAARRNELPASVQSCCESFEARSPATLYRSFSKEFSAARRRAPTVVHAHALYRFSASALAAALRHNLPTLLKLPTEHDASMLFESKRPGIRVFRPVLKRLDAFVCPSRAVVDELQRHINRTDQAVFLPNAVDTFRFRPAEEQERRTQRLQLAIPFEHVILFVGRHVTRKGGDVLLRAFAKCGPSLPSSVGLVFLGDGDRKPDWRKLARSLGIGDQVMFFDSHRAPEPFYSAADAFVLPSLFEGMPNALLEAMASGLPCLASQIGGVTDVLEDSFTGQLFPAGSVDALAAKLPGVLLPDARPIGSAMRTHVEAFHSVETISRQLIALYRKLIAGRVMP